MKSQDNIDYVNINIKKRYTKILRKLSVLNTGTMTSIVNEALRVFLASEEVKILEKMIKKRDMRISKNILSNLLRKEKMQNGSY